MEEMEQILLQIQELTGVLLEAVQGANAGGGAPEGGAPEGEAPPAGPPEEMPPGA